MKIIYLDCGMGASGDMLMGALSALLENPNAFIDKMNALGLPGVSVCAEKSVKCGIVGNHVRVIVNGEEEESHDHHAHEHEHRHSHAGLSDIRAHIQALPVSENVKNCALRVYNRIADAEATVHGTTVDQIHFHEVGSLDAVADVVGVSLLLEMLAPDRVIASPVRTGYGHVHCAHGMLPVPAPATAELLKGIPCYAGDISGEMLTPTGAALLKEIADEFGPMPVLKFEKTGYGMGSKDFPIANCVRAFLGNAEENSASPNDRIAQLACNLDDMTAEHIGYAINVLFAAGALDVFAQSVQMKKNRPGTLLTCLCRECDADKFAHLMLLHTTTRGVRRMLLDRYTLVSRTETVSTQYGDIRLKISEGFGIVKKKPEYEDIAEIAARENLSVAQVLENLHL